MAKRKLNQLVCEHCKGVVRDPRTLAGSQCDCPTYVFNKNGQAK